MGLELHPQSIKQNLIFPAKQEEELYPVQQDEIEKILRMSSPKLQNIILSLVSSGMREGYSECNNGKTIAWAVIGILPVSFFFALFGVFGGFGAKQ